MKHKVVAARLATAAAIGWFVAGTTATAQVVESFEQLPAVMRPGDVVTVTDQSGVMHKGRIAEIAETLLDNFGETPI